jgi:hypothetical protein
MFCFIFYEIIVNGWLQIYVNYFLIGFKMKKIISLFFTFSGICCCSGQQLPQNKDTIKVPLTSGANSLPVKNDSLFLKMKPAAVLYPNPAKNKVEIAIKGFDAGYIKLQLLSNSGKLVREETRLLFLGNETLVFMFSELSGIYYLILKQGTQMLKNKLMIQ